MNARRVRIGIGLAWIALLLWLGITAVYAENAQFTTDSLELKRIHESLAHSTDRKSVV